MPDGTPPGWGRAPHGGRDLNFLLSELTELSGQADVALPVAATLAGLWATPTRAELAGEDAARAMFRGLLTAAPGNSGPMPDWAWAPAPAPAGPEPVDATLVDIPLVAAHPADGPGRVLAGAHGRPGIRRRRTWARGWQGVTLIASSVVAVVAVGAVALAGTLSGSAGRQPPRETVSGAGHGTPASGGSTGTSGLTGTGQPTRVPSPTPTAAPQPAKPLAGRMSAPSPASPPSRADSPASATSPGATSAAGQACTRLFSLLTHPQPGDWAAEAKLYHELSQDAGSGSPWKIYSFCARILPAGSLPAGQPASWPTAPTTPSAPQATSGDPWPGWPGTSKGKGAGRRP